MEQPRDVFVEMALRLESLDDVGRRDTADPKSDADGDAEVHARRVNRLEELTERLRRLGPGGRGAETLECPLVFHDHLQDRLILQLRRLEARHSGMVERAFELLEEVITELEDLS